MTLPGPAPIFWPGSLVSRGFEALLEAAAAGGFGHMAIGPLTIAGLLEEGRRPAELIAEADAAGIVLSVLDGVSSWAPIACEEDAPAHLRARFDFDAGHCLDMAESLGLGRILAVAAFGRGALGVDELVAPFATFCRAAAERDLIVELEFVPFWGVPTLGMAWDIARRADAPNGRLLVDTWHLHKGSEDFERDMALLESLPDWAVTGVQLADAATARQDADLYAEGRLRLFPGDGEIDVARILSVIAAKGALRHVGTELFGDAIDALSNEEAGRRSGDVTRATLRRATHGVLHA
jgi:sugar phosphate isomerase/epimerase